MNEHVFRQGEWLKELLIAHLTSGALRAGMLHFEVLDEAVAVESTLGAEGFLADDALKWLLR